MTAINRLNNKQEPSLSDLIAIWDSESGRAKNTSFNGALKTMFTQVNPVVSISFTSPNLTVTKFDGAVENIDLTP